ncbi:MAG: hypothetical protein HRT68_00380 [Flavobacteriaceae bacterium]|nr:hypothetical protein [Flavobacteriaceae bacterium]
MTPSKKGRFCDNCAKHVVDLSQSSNAEINQAFKKHKANLCTRVTSNQLNSPILEFKEKIRIKIPYSKTAAGIALATSLATSTKSCSTENNSFQIHHSDGVNTEETSVNSKKAVQPKKKKPANRIVFKGKVVAQERNVPVELAQISFITTNCIYVAFTDAEGN